MQCARRGAAEAAGWVALLRGGDADLSFSMGCHLMSF
jgi:hypothetical protein